MLNRLILATCAVLALSGCFRDSQNVYQNVSVHADRFEVQRRIWLNDALNNTDRIAVEGLCAFWPEPTHLRVVCKVGDEYIQNTFGLTPYVTFSVEQLDPIPVETDRREH